MPCLKRDFSCVFKGTLKSEKLSQRENTHVSDLSHEATASIWVPLNRMYQWLHGGSGVDIEDNEVQPPSSQGT